MRINLVLPIVAAMMAMAAAPAPIVLASGTKVIDTKVGKGVEALPGKLVTVNYTGWLYQDGMRAKKFDSSIGRAPFDFPLGGGQVIQGWDEGIAGMKVGGKRTLIIPPAAGYGDRGAGDDIPPGSTLIFDVELLKVE